MERITDKELQKELVALWEVIHQIVDKLGIEIDFDKPV